jgi:hypothetical protein
LRENGRVTFYSPIFVFGEVMKIFLSIVILFLSVNPALGCSYIGYPDPPLSYVISKIDTIFIGTIVSVNTTRENDSNGNKFRRRTVKLKVDQTLKGTQKEFQEITSYERLTKDSYYVKPTKYMVGQKWLMSKNHEKNRRHATEAIRLLIRQTVCV